MPLFLGIEGSEESHGGTGTVDVDDGATAGKGLPHDPRVVTLREVLDGNGVAAQGVEDESSVADALGGGQYDGGRAVGGCENLLVHRAYHEIWVQN